MGKCLDLKSNTLIDVFYYFLALLYDLLNMCKTQRL